MARNPKHQLIQYNDQNFAVIDFGKKISKDLTKYFDKEILLHGEEICSGGAFGAAALPILGAGSAVASSLFAGNIFLATANPATLMALGNGVGSAVMGAGGIISQAPFIAASSAIIPVVAPVMFFMTISSMMMSVRFDKIEAQLQSLSTLLMEILKRDMATDLGQLFGARERILDIDAEFTESRKFTPEMVMRLILIERDVNALQGKYQILVKDKINKVSLQFKETDIKLYVFSALLDLYVQNLRLKLSIQQNPDDVQRKSKVLTDRIEEYHGIFTDLRDNNPVTEYKEELDDSIEKMGMFKKIFSHKKYKKNEEKKEIRDMSQDFVKSTTKGLTEGIKMIEKMEDTENEYSVVFYREDNGKGKIKSFYTKDLVIQ